MVNRKTASALTIAALLACAVPVKSIASALVLPVSSSLLAQATPNFPVPDSVEENTEVTISSSSNNMNAISEALKSGFESEYDGSEVLIETKDANAAIQDVLNDNADLAAISRPLTEEEKAKGLIAVPVRREKIAIVVDKDNPFSQSITGEQFAQIFRGEVKDWSEVGGDAGPIKLVDRPATSETRQSLRPYPVFRAAPFNAVAGATTLEVDTTDAVVEALGTNGISYLLVGELDSQLELKALQLHKTPPTDPKYPFSQPYAFVYAGGASSEVRAFLGYATGNPGQAAVNDAGVSGVGLIPNAGGGAPTPGVRAAAGSATEASEEATPDADGETPDATVEGAISDNSAGEASNAVVAGFDGVLGTSDDINIAGADGILGTADDIRGLGPDGEYGTADDIDLAGLDGIPGTADDVVLAGPDGEIETDDDVVISETNNIVIDETLTDRDLADSAGDGKWWWLLLPLAGLGLLIWAAGRRSSEEETSYITNVKDDDRVRSNIDGDTNLNEGTNFSGGRNVGGGGLDTDIDRTNVGDKGLGLGEIAASGAAITSGTAVASTDSASPVRNKADDITVDLQAGVSSSSRGSVDGLKGGVNGAEGNVQGSIDSARGNIQGDVDGIRGNTQGGIDGVRSGVQSSSVGNVRGGTQDSIDGVGGNVDSARSNVQGSSVTAKGNGDSWLDRAKQRINEATEQIKDTTSDIKDDMSGKD